MGAYLLHEVTFYFLLCYRPFGIQFHVETSLFNIYFAKLDREILKPVRWGVSDQHLDQVKSFGVKIFEDFTWKHMLDFYSCADCGRCSDNCPANAWAGHCLRDSSASRHETMPSSTIRFLDAPTTARRSLAAKIPEPFTPRMKSGLAPPAELAKKNARC